MVLLITCIIFIIVIIIVTIIYTTISLKYVDENLIFKNFKRTFDWNTGYHTKLNGYNLPNTKDKKYNIDKNIVITAAARDINPNILRTNMERLIQIGKTFNNYIICIYENDSTNETKDILYEYSKLKDNIYIELNNWEDEDLNLKLLDRMKLVRHRCKKFTEKIVQENHFKPDILLLYDIDVIGGIHPSSLDMIFTESLDWWDALFSNGLSYSLSTGPHSKYFHWIFQSTIKEYDSLAYETSSGQNFCSVSEYLPFMDRKHINMHKNILVNSAFGGSALYKYDIYKRGNYLYSNDYKCEHRIFHESLNSQKLFISKWLLTIR